MAELIAEDLLLLLLDDERGTTPSLWVDVKVPLAAAVLAELALDGAVELEPGTFLSSAKVRATGREATDPVLSAALAVVAEKPRSPSSLVERVGTTLRDALAARLVQRGLLERRDERVLGLFPRTTWPTVDREHEEGVRARLRAVLLEGAAPDGRDTALIGVLSALDRVPQTIGATGPDGRTAKRAAKAIAQGEWTSKAVSDAMQSMIAAVMVPVMATTVITTTN